MVKQEKIRFGSRFRSFGDFESIQVVAGTMIKESTAPDSERAWKGVQQVCLGVGYAYYYFRSGSTMQMIVINPSPNLNPNPFVHLY